MSDFTGMNIEAVQQLGRDLITKSGEITTIMNNLTTQLDAVTWQGPDATQFRDQWNGEYKTKLQDVATALDNAGQAANRNATEQTDASRAV